MPTISLHLSTRTLAHWLVLSSLCVAAQLAQAAIPYLDQPVTFTQPNGEKIVLTLTGNDYFAEQRAANGALVVYDNKLKGYSYASISADGLQLQSLGQLVRSADTKTSAGHSVPWQRQPGLSSKAKAQLVAARQAELFGTDAAELQPSQLKRGDDPALQQHKPAAALSGAVKGLTVIIQFPDQAGTISKPQVEAFLNDLNYSGFGNAQSVRGYFRAVSGNKLDYTNTVTRYYTAKRNKSYYTDNSLSSSVRSQELITEALNWLEKTEGFNFASLTTNSSKQILGLNFFYSGDSDSAWSKGLWPHMGGLSPRFCADGVCSSRYQITNMGSTMAIGTFAHETGHLLLGWPDLYDYDGSSEGSVAAFCLMGYGAIGTHNKYKPTPPVGVFRHLAGWDSVTELNPRLNSAAPVGTITHIAESRSLYRWSNPARTSEAFYFEAIHQSGQHQHQPDAGLAIWHLDPSGNNSNEWKPYIQMEHGDGNRDPEYKRNRGDAGDLFDGNVSYQFNKTAPNALTSRGTNALWWNGTDSGLSLTDISPPAPAISFRLISATPPGGETYAGSLAAAASVIVPNNSYFQYNGGTLTLTLTGPASANFDLYLEKWQNSSWQTVAQSRNNNASEHLSYSAGSGYYRARISAVIGSGAYQLVLRK